MGYFPRYQSHDESDGEKMKFASSIKSFLSFVSRRCSRRSSGADFIHPTFEDTSPKFRPNKTSQDKNTYFLSRSQQDELRRQVALSAAVSLSRSRSQSNPVALIAPVSKRHRSTSIDFPSFSSPKSSPICLTDSPGPQRSHEAVVSRTTSSTLTSHSQCTSIKLETETQILCCDKCDGKHETDDCPHYKKKREVHLDGQKNGWKLCGESSNLPGAVLRMARVIPQAGDGSCLFHSMSYGIKDGSDASSLRKEICAYIQAHPQTPICKTPLSDWVKWDSGVSCADYARMMKSGAWGGGIEMACMSQLKGCNVHVYESGKLGGYKRISAFDHPIQPEVRRIVRVLYRGGVHYDALVKLV